MTKNQKFNYILIAVLVLVAIILMWDWAFGFIHHDTGLSNAINEGVKSLGAK